MLNNSYSHKNFFFLNTGTSSFFCLLYANNSINKNGNILSYISMVESCLVEILLKLDSVSH